MGTNMLSVLRKHRGVGKGDSHGPINVCGRGRNSLLDFRRPGAPRITEVSYGCTRPEPLVNERSNFSQPLPRAVSQSNACSLLLTPSIDWPFLIQAQAYTAALLSATAAWSECAASLLAPALYSDFTRLEAERQGLVQTTWTHRLLRVDVYAKGLLLEGLQRDLHRLPLPLSVRLTPCSRSVTQSVNVRAPDATTRPRAQNSASSRWNRERRGKCPRAAVCAPPPPREPHVVGGERARTASNALSAQRHL